MGAKNNRPFLMIATEHYINWVSDVLCLLDGDLLDFICIEHDSSAS